MHKRIKQVLSLLVVVAMLVICVPTGLATEDQTSDTVPVTITASAPTFSVTVPTTLPIHMDVYGGITCGDITITNNSSGSVLVEDTQITALNGWTLADYATTTFTDANKGQHRAALQLNRSNGLTASGSDTNEDFIPAGGGRQTISVSAKIPYQGVNAVNTNIAQIIFVLGWNNEEIPLTGLKVVPEMPYMNVGDTQTLTITKIPEDTTDSNPIRVEYAGHLDGNQMNVSESGEITALGAGTTDVWITCGDYTMLYNIVTAGKSDEIILDVGGQCYSLDYSTYHSGSMITFYDIPVSSDKTVDVRLLKHYNGLWCTGLPYGDMEGYILYTNGGSGSGYRPDYAYEVIPALEEGVTLPIYEDIETCTVYFRLPSTTQP